MFVLDNHVVSELREVKSGKADARVAAWAVGLSPGSLCISAITILELEMGGLMRERREATQGAMLHAWLDDHVLPAFAGRVLAVDSAVASAVRACTCPNEGAAGAHVLQSA